MNSDAQTISPLTPNTLADALERLIAEAARMPATQETRDELLHHLTCAQVSALRLASEAALASTPPKDIPTRQGEVDDDEPWEFD